jgi:gliding motility-associated-like protein
MKRLLTVISSSLFFIAPAFANHITGGEMFYTFLGRSGGNYNYHITLKLYRDCNAPPGSAQLDDAAAIGIFDKTTGTMTWNQDVPLARIVVLNLGSPSPCITNPPLVCYQVGYYEADVLLPGSPDGYIIAFQRCCRIAGINNLQGSNSVGTTYTAEIPGTSASSTDPENNSARFIGADTVIVCAKNAFTYSFAAQDDDGDALTYSFCNAYMGGSIGNAAPDPPLPPPYNFVPYAFTFNGLSPMGSGITLNTTTGLLSGIAPDAGIYVVTVCVTERRNGVLIATQRKDLQIKIGDCDIAKALLKPQYITCDGFTMTFQNLSLSPLINTYFWDFGVAGLTADTSNLDLPTYTYPDTGVYTIKLVTNRNQQCSDSTTAIVKVFPGFFPGFTVNGACFTNPFHFSDTTNTRYGVVDSWSWNFGDLSTIADTSQLQNPDWTYPAGGPKDVTFIVTNSKGCKDTVLQTLNVFDKPPINLAFRDTLICVPDNLQLNASGTGIFSWSPLINISNPGTATPTVNPTSSTTYYVDLDDNGCLNRDSVKVRVVNFVTLQANNDTTICQGDAIQLGASTDGLLFDWTPALNLDDPTLLNPIAITTTTTTTYQITARVGSCLARDQLIVTTVPYPIALAGNDTVICYNTAAQLNGLHDGVFFSWSPASYLNDPNILNPVSSPPRTMTYILSAFDTLGCPKPGRDTILITVLPRVRAFAGNDTSVVVGEPLQFNGSGGVGYLWSPATGLNNTTIANPVGVYTFEIDNIPYKLTVTDAAGCADSAFVRIKVFKTNPTVFVPTAFTPNSDGKNDVVRPIAVGIKKINYFSIYNRWGQLVFTTTINGRGWDGKIAGQLQGSNTFVWMVSAIDYIGKPVFLKGTVTLIR